MVFNLHFCSEISTVGDQTSKALSANRSGRRLATGCNSGQTA